MPFRAVQIVSKAFKVAEQELLAQGNEAEAVRAFTLQEAEFVFEDVSEHQPQNPHLPFWGKPSRGFSPLSRSRMSSDGVEATFLKLQAKFHLRR